MDKVDNLDIKMLYREVDKVDKEIIYFIQIIHPSFMRARENVTHTLEVIMKRFALILTLILFLTPTLTLADAIPERDEFGDIIIAYTVNNLGGPVTFTDIPCEKDWPEIGKVVRTSYRGSRKRYGCWKKVPEANTVAVVWVGQSRATTVGTWYPLNEVTITTAGQGSELDTGRNAQATEAMK